MTHEKTNSTPRLEIKASKSFNRFGVFIYLIGLLGIPFMLLKAFGPGAAGDTAVNGNSIWAFWFMRALLAVFWIACLSGLRKSWRIVRELPVLFVLEEKGITDREGITTPWIEFQRAYYVSRAWNVYLDVRPNSQFKKMVVKEEEIGWSAMGEIKSFMRKHAPRELTRELE